MWKNGFLVPIIWKIIIIIMTMSITSHIQLRYIVFIAFADIIRVVLIILYQAVMYWFVRIVTIERLQEVLLLSLGESKRSMMNRR